MMAVTNESKCYFGNYHIFLHDFSNCMFLFYNQVVNGRVVLWEWPMCYTLVSKVNDFQCVDCSSSSSSAITLEHIQPPVLHVTSFVSKYCTAVAAHL